MTRTNVIACCSDQQMSALMRDEKKLSGSEVLAFECAVYCHFVTFPFGILGQVWYLIVSIPNPCCLYYFKTFFSCFTNIFSTVNFKYTVVGIFKTVV